VPAGSRSTSPGSTSRTTAAPDQSRLADLWQQAGLPENVLTDWLASEGNEGDSEIEKRFKTAVEGAGFGALTEGVVLAARSIRSAIRAKAGPPASEAVPPAVTDRDLILLGDPNAPLLKISTEAEPEALAEARRGAKLSRGMEAGEGIDLGYAAASTARDAAAALRMPSLADIKATSGADSAFVTLSDGGEDLARIPRFDPTGPGGDLPVKIKRGTAIYKLGTDEKVTAARAAGYDDQMALIGDVTANWTDIFDGGKGRLLIAKRNGKNAGTVVEVAARNDGEYYDVVTAGLWRDRYLNKKKALLSRSRPTDDTVAGPSYQSAGGRSNSDISARRVEINFARINEPDDVQKVMDDMAQAFAPRIDAARRGVQTNEATQRLASDLGLTVGDLLNRRKGQPFNAEQALAARQMMNASGEKLLEAARKAATLP